MADQNGKSIPSDVRTSLGTFVPHSYDKVIDRIERRVAEVTKLPASESWACSPESAPTSTYLTVFIIEGHQEKLQILRYRVGERYEPHFDWFNDVVSPEAGGKWTSI